MTKPKLKIIIFWILGVPRENKDFNYGGFFFFTKNNHQIYQYPYVYVKERERYIIKKKKTHTMVSVLLMVVSEIGRQDQRSHGGGDEELK